MTLGLREMKSLGTVSRAISRRAVTGTQDSDTKAHRCLLPPESCGLLGDGGCPFRLKCLFTSTQMCPVTSSSLQALLSLMVRAPKPFLGAPHLIVKTHPKGKHLAA